jgi:hypothetical protein
VSRARFVLLLLGITAVLATVAATIHRAVDPQARTDVAALVVSAASLALAALTFYLLELRGADIIVRQQLETGARYNKERGVWQGDGFFKATIECRLLIANEGRRPGVLEAFVLGTPSFAPHRPRMLRVHLHTTHGEDSNEIRPPIILSDGGMLSAVVPIELSPGTTKGDFVQACAHDLREIDHIVVPFDYTYTSHGVVYRRSGSASAPLRDVRDDARTIWKEIAAAQAAYRILSEEKPT